MGEHGKRAAPKAATSRSDVAPKASASHGRNRATRVERDRSRRWGLLTAETAIVLGVAAAIVAGAFMVEALQPAGEKTTTTVGKDTIVEHNLGTGGVKPGPLQRRVIVPQPVKPATPTALPTTTAKPGKTPKPVVTAGPTEPGGVIPGPGTGGAPCTPIPLIRTCPAPVTEETPEPTPEPEPSTAPTNQAGTQAASSSSKTAKKKPVAPPSAPPSAQPPSESTSR